MHEAMKVLEEDGQTLRVVLSGRLDSSTVDEIEPALRARLDDGTQHVLVDLREVSFAASMAIRMFIATARRLQQLGRQMVLFGAQPLPGLRALLGSEESLTGGRSKNRIVH